MTKEEARELLPGGCMTITLTRDEVSEALESYWVHRKTQKHLSVTAIIVTFMGVSPMLMSQSDLITLSLSEPTEEATKP